MLGFSELDIILASLNELFDGLVVVTRCQSIVVDLHLNRILRESCHVGLPFTQRGLFALNRGRLLRHWLAWFIWILLDLTVFEVLLFLSIAGACQLIEAIPVVAGRNKTAIAEI